MDIRSYAPPIPLSNRSLLKYMRGDTTSEWLNRPQDALDQYIHTYYEDVEQVYRDGIFSLFNTASM